MKTWMWFVVIAVISWGAYVPMVHKGALAFSGGKGSGSFRAFLFVGLAYFLMAGAILLYLSMSKAEPLLLNSRAAGISTIAGVLGAAGALGVIFATSRYGGSPLIVAPLVFAGAPIVNTFVSMLMHRPENAPKPMFYVGLLLAAAGAAMVLRFRPT